MRTDSTPGIIPANTGRMPQPSNGRTHRRDHPREYGENRSGFGDKVEPDGSSPRIRGECTRLAGTLLHNRIIPANTGRIVLLRAKCGHGGDHPREYGENSLPMLCESFVTGSSPRIRGEC